MAEVIVALVAAIPATIAALAARRQARKTHAEVATNHGRRPGEYLELIHADIQHLKELSEQHSAALLAHLGDNTRHN